jgi:hypothetical protein
MKKPKFNVAASRTKNPKTTFSRFTGQTLRPTRPVRRRPAPAGSGESLSEVTAKGAVAQRPRRVRGDQVGEDRLSANGGFTFARLAFADFGFDTGWRVAQHSRYAEDITGDGLADLIGFGIGGVYTAVAQGNGVFA